MAEHPNSPRPFCLITGAVLVAAGITGIMTDAGDVGRDAALATGASIGATLAFGGVVWRLRRYLNETRSQ